MNNDARKSGRAAGAAERDVAGGAAGALGENLALLANRRCTLDTYKPVQVRPLKITGPFIAYASPDSTFAVTKRLFDAARKSILIGIYDFSATHVKELVLRAMERGVKVSLMLDIDSAAERDLFKSLAEFGCEAVVAPSCASEHAHFFASSHEKVIVIDNRWTLVQSGNYSNRSCPFNERDGADPDNFVPGNRDMGVAIDSPPLARFFTKILRADMKLELDAEVGAAVRASSKPAAAPLATAAPTKVPARLFPSKRFTFDAGIEVQPVLTPDNYMDVIPDFIASATTSILIEQQYIRTAHDAIRTLLDAIVAAREKNSRLEIKIILANPMDEAGRVEIEALSEFGLKLGTHVRILSPAHFTHCHNKLIVIDRREVLISSQNWSRTAVLTNREAGVLLRSAKLAKYFADIFDQDWETGVKTVRRVAAAEFLGAAALNTGAKLVRVEPGDYIEV